MWTRSPREQLSVVNTIHIQMRGTKFGTETSTRPPPSLPKKNQQHNTAPFVKLTRAHRSVIWLIQEEDCCAIIKIIFYDFSFAFVFPLAWNYNITPTDTHAHKACTRANKSARTRIISLKSRGGGTGGGVLRMDFKCI